MTRRILIIITIVLSSLIARADTFRFYIDDQTGWGNNFALYVWGDSELYGGWPGAKNPAVTLINGVGFKTFTYSAAPNAAVNYHLIASNNGDSQTQLQDFDVSLARDYYFRATISGLVEIEAPSGSTPSTGSLIVDNTTPISPANRVIYELNLYDFTSAGTLQAAKNRLPELRRLGIDIIWLMPIYPRSVQGRIGSLGSPYAARDFTAVNPDHGTLADLKSFVSEAHRLGMAVWLDWVPNHTGLDHVWVSSHPEYYVWQNGAIVHPNNYGDVYQLNYNSAALRNAMTDAMLYWVNEADIDGFRCDYVSSSAIPVSYWQQAIPALQNNNRSKRVEMLGEADFIPQPSLYAAGFQYDYAWQFNTALKSIGTGTDITNLRSEAQRLLNLLNTANYSAMNSMVYLTNHDDIGDNFSANYLTQVGVNVAPLTVMFFTLYGMPLLYNGQEVAQPTILNYFNRNSINWQVTSANRPIVNTIRALIALKHTMPALADGSATTRGATSFIATNRSSVIAYRKSKGDNSVLVVINFGNSETDVTLSGIAAGNYTRVLDSRTIASGFNIEDVYLTSSPVIHLPAKGYQVYVFPALPAVSTDINQPHILSTGRSGEVSKILYNGQILLLSDNKIYTAQGALLKTNY